MNVKVKIEGITSQQLVILEKAGIVGSHIKLVPVYPTDGEGRNIYDGQIRFNITDECNVNAEQLKFLSEASALS